MSRDEGRVDSHSFAVRRELRDILARLIDRGWWRPKQYEQALARLGEQRKLALRQILRIFEEGRVTDEVAALEILGKLATFDDDPDLAAVANDPKAFEGARVASALVLLGHDRSELLTSPDISAMVLRWQARYVAEEPGMRGPLIRLYSSAPRDERARWIMLQEQELREPCGRAAVFEMLLEQEKDPELRSLILRGLDRYPSPCARAVLQRAKPLHPDERETIMGSLARLAAAADPETVPDGWSARVGFCDGSGTYPLRFDFRRPQARHRSVIFLLCLSTGVREALALIGSDIERYDRAGSAEEDACTSFHQVPVAQALRLLHDAERTSLRCEIATPRDFSEARVLLDPLTDLDPKPASAPVALGAQGDASKSLDLFNSGGYGGWFYDAGDHLFDDLRLEVLRTCDPATPPAEDLLTLAVERLQDSGEIPSIVRRLEHNAFVHTLAGDQKRAATALATAHACLGPDFVELPLIRRMVRESLHPGHYFFAPVPDCTQRRDLALLMLSSARPSRSRVLAVDLAWILTRAADVWLSRVPSAERPHSDQIQSAVLELALVGARWITSWMGSHGADLGTEKDATRITFGGWRDSLRERYRDTLRESGLSTPSWDECFDRLTGLLLWASESLVFRVCLGTCKMRCPLEPRRSGLPALESPDFPGGPDAEAQIRTWPGLYFQQPTSLQEGALRSLLEASRQTRGQMSVGPTYRCGVCGNQRPVTTRSRSHLMPLQGGEAEEVCRRCQGRYRRDPGFRADVISRLGRLMS